MSHVILDNMVPFDKTYLACLPISNTFLGSCTHLGQLITDSPQLAASLRFAGRASFVHPMFLYPTSIACRSICQLFALGGHAGRSMEHLDHLHESVHNVLSESLSSVDAEPFNIHSVPTNLAVCDTRFIASIVHNSDSAR